MNSIQWVWIVLLILLLGANLYFFMLKRKQKESHYYIKIKFVGGNKTKLVLNQEQYEQMQAFLNQTDGHFEIGDDQDNVKIYREFICVTEVKKH